MTYSEKLKDPRWQKKRLEILQRDNWTCQICGCTENTLNVHHEKYDGDPWEISDKELITICEKCHYNKHILLKYMKSRETLNKIIKEYTPEMIDDISEILLMLKSKETEKHKIEFILYAFKYCLKIDKIFINFEV